MGQDDKMNKKGNKMRNIIILLMCILFSFFNLFANEDSLYVTIHDDSVMIWHINHYAHCAASFEMKTQIIDTLITITEKDLAKDFADCMCYFNLSVILLSLEPGT